MQLLRRGIWFSITTCLYLLFRLYLPKGERWVIYFFSEAIHLPLPLDYSKMVSRLYNDDRLLLAVPMLCALCPHHTY